MADHCPPEPQFPLCVMQIWSKWTLGPCCFYCPPILAAPPMWGEDAGLCLQTLLQRSIGCSPPAVPPASLRNWLGWRCSRCTPHLEARELGVHLGVVCREPSWGYLCHFLLPTQPFGDPSLIWEARGDSPREANLRLSIPSLSGEAKVGRGRADPLPPLECPCPPPPPRTS
jgi:hypothetical protein